MASLFAQVSEYDQGVVLIQKGQLTAAVPLLILATEAHPAQARAWAALGVAYAAQGMYDLAEPPFAHACDLDPKLHDACYYEGRALYALGRFEASIQVLERADRFHPNSWKIRLGIAQALEAVGKAVDAEKTFRATLALVQASDPQPGVALGLFLVRQGRSDEAIGHLAEVLNTFPSCAEAHLQLGRALLEQDKISRALPHLEQAAKTQPASAQAHTLLAKAYMRLGRTSDAQPHFEAAVKLEQAGNEKEN